MFIYSSLNYHNLWNNCGSNWISIRFNIFVFQELLQRNREIIKDVNEIQCGKLEGDEIIYYAVLALKRSDVCILNSEHTIQPIDILNVALAMTIMFIIIKLCYDYYNFRFYGQLPWIVTKLPWRTWLYILSEK